jgi:ribosome-binding factor A
MPKDFARSRRVAEQLHRLLGEILRRDVKDPRARGVTITGVDVSGDMAHATVWFSLLDPDSDPGPVGTALSGAAGLIRSRLGRAMHIRQVPALHFRHDESLERGARLSALIDQAVASDRARDDEEE